MSVEEGIPKSSPLLMLLPPQPLISGSATSGEFVYNVYQHHCLFITSLAGRDVRFFAICEASSCTCTGDAHGCSSCSRLKGWFSTSWKQNLQISPVKLASLKCASTQTLSRVDLQVQTPCINPFRTQPYR